MNTPSNAMNGSPIDAQRIAPTITSQTRPLYWSIRRELWENRSIYIAPLAVAGVVLFGFVIATIGRAVATVDTARKAAVMSEHTGFAAGIIMAVAFVVGIFYSLEALHGERRDRSILFWKSLPVSDLTTVLSKAGIPLVILPLITIVVIFATQLIMTVLSTLFLLGSGLSAANQWASFFQMSLGMTYHLITVHVLWHAPIYAWLLLVSAWARRAAFLWATLPLVAIGVLEKIAFNTAHFAHWMGYRLAGPESFELAESARMPTHHFMSADPATFLSAPGLWLGLVLAALLLAATVRLRRYQGPI